MKANINEFKATLTEKSELYIRIKVHPNSSKTGLSSIMEDETLKINLKAVPEKGKANIELIKFLAKEFDCGKSCVKIISGAGERTKLVKISIETH